MKPLFLAIALAGVVPGALAAQDLLVAFDGGIGVDPASGVTPTGGAALNVVRGVSPGMFPWRISRLHANVHVDGHIEVDGRGLLLTGGNPIGTNGGQSVFATLFCGPAATATAHSSSPAGVALEPNGDFRIDDVLSPPPSTSCTDPVLLILSAANGHWFAAGIPKNDADER
ncbi:MAG TPA: hypothetical protein VG454_07840 [Gemmatimonadales bacterium]|nr:hypothetical protein [Gemmatimonadales bacterium]